MTEILELTDTDFEEKIEGKSGVFLFYKELCPFCKALEAVMDKFAKANPDVPLFRADFEKQTALSTRFEVERAPTLFILKNGGVVEKKTGVMNPKELSALYSQATT